MLKGVQKPLKHTESPDNSKAYGKKMLKPTKETPKYTLKC